MAVPALHHVVKNTSSPSLIVRAINKPRAFCDIAGAKALPRSGIEITGDLKVVSCKGRLTRPRAEMTVWFDPENATFAGSVQHYSDAIHSICCNP